MTWHRRVVYNSDSYPTTFYTLSDLNLRSYRETTGLLEASSLDSNDNVEQVVSSSTDPLVIRAYAWSTAFSGASSEAFCIAVPPGTVRADGPSLAVQPNTSSYTPPLGAKFLVYLRVNNTGDLAAHNCALNVTLPACVALVSGSTSAHVGTVPAGGSSGYVELWLSATTSGANTVTCTVTSDSYGSDWVGYGSFTVSPGPEDKVPPCSTLTVGGTTHQIGGTDLMANEVLSRFHGLGHFGGRRCPHGFTEFGHTPCWARARHRLTDRTVRASASRAVELPLQNTAALAWAGCSSGQPRARHWQYPFRTSASSPIGHVHVDVSRFRGQQSDAVQLRLGNHGSSSTLWLDDVTLKEDETIWTDSALPALVVSSLDDRSGMDVSQYAIGPGIWTACPVEGFSLPQEGLNTVHYRSTDNSANVEPTVSTLVGRDTQPSGCLASGSRTCGRSSEGGERGL